LKSHRLFISRIPGYIISRTERSVPPPPVNLTFSVTQKCNSKCATCGIGEHGITSGGDLALPEIEKFLSTAEDVTFFNISGGEPFLRRDLPDICALAARLVHPDVIHIPTNAILTDRILSDTEEICRRVFPVKVTIKPSMDGVGALHDEIRGVKGNFEKLMNTYRALISLGKRVSNLETGLGTVVSRFNVDRFSEILDLVRQLSPDSYITEVAEERAEMTNLGTGITPTAQQYADILGQLRRYTLDRQADARGVARLTLAFRAVYYDLTYRWLQTGDRPLPCWAGTTHAHVAPDGEVWACCVLGGTRAMGHLRDTDMDFGRVWSSATAMDVREYVRQGLCSCPLANQSYANMVLSPPAAARTAGHMIRGTVARIMNRGV